jgi:hypothetical protein
MATISSFIKQDKFIDNEDLNIIFKWEKVWFQSIIPLMNWAKHIGNFMRVRWLFSWRNAFIFFLSFS